MEIVSLNQIMSGWHDIVYILHDVRQIHFLISTVIKNTMRNSREKLVFSTKFNRINVVALVN